MTLHPAESNPDTRLKFLLYWARQGQIEARKRHQIVSSTLPEGRRMIGSKSTIARRELFSSPCRLPGKNLGKALDISDIKSDNAL
jgi:hypothetical protein